MVSRLEAKPKLAVVRLDDRGRVEGEPCCRVVVMAVPLVTTSASRGSASWSPAVFAGQLGSADPIFVGVVLKTRQRCVRSAWRLALLVNDAGSFFSGRILP